MSTDKEPAKPPIVLENANIFCLEGKTVFPTAEQIASLSEESESNDGIEVDNDLPPTAKEIGAHALQGAALRQQIDEVRQGIASLRATRGLEPQTPELTPTDS